MSQLPRRILVQSCYCGGSCTDLFSLTMAGGSCLVRRGALKVGYCRGSGLEMYCRGVIPSRRLNRLVR